ncbi:MAG: hypothetical protein OQK75_12795 [Gammaproteobacteria bacterium]|nr:hypothetical protein [Gammaproteobacteria bacterium]MCW8988536.1 hypothetical protein [Gammaproteobacteria bacterium]
MLHHLKFILLFSLMALNVSVVNAAETLPDDIRYMLEDLHGTNKNEWPVIKKEDLNNDGLPDWVAQKNNCNKKNNCPLDIFICIPGKKGECSEYCYMEVKALTHLAEDLKILKCESTC